MNVQRICLWGLLAAGVAVGTGQGWAAQPGQPPAAEEGVQVLTSGPVHEAFAETVGFDPEPGIVVSKGPPAAIEELPPEQRLEGENVAWIPGYWAWDDERSDFLWVSGIWRNLPPGRQWLPGYWSQTAQGFQWTSGYWGVAKASQVEYLSEPPESVEAGPNKPASSADQTWLPGCWIWRDARYIWRPGFWSQVEPDWVWVPSYYVWAPRGYVYVPGYWDYAVARRGVLFAPVYFDSGVYSRRGFYYSPSTVIDLALFTEHLFLRPHYQHYYFGDYYAASYAQAGFYPWYSFRNQHGYDPIYAHQRWEHRQDGEWEHRLAADFTHRRDHDEARPPRTLAAQTALSARGASSLGPSHLVGRSLDQLTKSPTGALKFQPVNKEERHAIAKRGQDVQKFRETRQKLEAQTAAALTERPASNSGPARVKLPKSPIRGQTPAQLTQDRAPPKAHKVPRPDPQVQPKPRVLRSSEQPRSPAKVERPQPQPRAERQPTPQPRAERQPTPQPRAERQPTPQPRAERAPAPRQRESQPAGSPARGGQREERSGRGKGKG